MKIPRLQSQFSWVSQSFFFQQKRHVKLSPNLRKTVTDKLLFGSNMIKYEEKQRRISEFSFFFLLFLLLPGGGWNAFTQFLYRYHPFLCTHAHPDTLLVKINKKHNMRQQQQFVILGALKIYLRVIFIGFDVISP